MRIPRGQRQALAADIRLGMLEMWRHNTAPLSGAFSIVEMYVELFLNQLDPVVYAAEPPERIRVVPKATSALALYQTLGLAGLLPKPALARPDPTVFSPVISRHLAGDVSPFKLGGNLDQAIGLALAAALTGHGYPVVAFVGDGELQVGIDHQARWAALMGLDNLALFVDCNGLQSDYRTQQADLSLAEDPRRHLSTLAAMWELYGWETHEIDGHNFDELEHVMGLIGCTQRPLVVFARTVKGKGISFAEGRLGFNHRLTDAQFGQAYAELQRAVNDNSRQGHRLECHRPLSRPVMAGRKPIRQPQLVAEPQEDLEEVLRRWLEGAMQLNPDRLVVLNTDNPRPLAVDFPTYAPGRASQLVFPGSNELFALNLARGLSNAGMEPIYVSPATHLMIAGEEWKLAALDHQPLLLVGRTPGSDLCRWGPSHVAYEDLERFRTDGARVYQPATGADLLAILRFVYGSERAGPVYLRLPRMQSACEDVLQPTADEWDAVIRNGFYVLSEDVAPREPARPFVAFLASGAAVKACREAGEFLAQRGIGHRVVNVLDLTRLDAPKLQAAVGGAGALVTAIDAQPEALLRPVWEALPARERPKVQAVGVTRIIRGPATLETIHKENGLDATSLAKIALVTMRFL